MIESNIEAIVYHNPSYENTGCFTVWVKNAGLFKATKFYVCRILAKPNTEVNEDNIETYMASRGFKKVLESLTGKDVIWYNDYDRSRATSIQIRDMLNRIIANSRHSAFEMDNVGKWLGYIKRLDNKIKEY